MSTAMSVVEALFIKLVVVLKCLATVGLALVCLPVLVLAIVLMVLSITVSAVICGVGGVCILIF